MERKVYVIVFWQDILIGTIYSNIEEQYIYCPNYDNIFSAMDKGMPPLPQIIEPQLKWDKMPGFFKERIQNDPEFKQSCRYATDKFKLVLVI